MKLIDCFLGRTDDSDVEEVSWEVELEGLEYFHANLNTKDEMLEYMKLYRKQTGSFLLRKSFTNSNALTVSVIHNEGVKNFSIQRDPDSNCTNFQKKYFLSIKSFVQHYRQNDVPNLDGIKNIRLTHPIQCPYRSRKPAQPPSLAPGLNGILTLSKSNITAIPEETDRPLRRIITRDVARGDRKGPNYAQAVKRSGINKTGYGVALAVNVEPQPSFESYLRLIGEERILRTDSLSPDDPCEDGETSTNVSFDFRSDSFVSTDYNDSTQYTKLQNFEFAQKGRAPSEIEDLENRSNRLELSLSSCQDVRSNRLEQSLSSCQDVKSNRLEQSLSSCQDVKSNRLEQSLSSCQNVISNRLEQSLSSCQDVKSNRLELSLSSCQDVMRSVHSRMEAIYPPSNPYYSSARSSNKDLLPDLMTALKDAVCDCGLSDEQAHFDIGWSVHLTPDEYLQSHSEMPLFFQGPKGETTWHLPPNIYEILSVEEKKRLKEIEESAIRGLRERQGTGVGAVS